MSLARFRGTDCHTSMNRYPTFPASTIRPTILATLSSGLLFYFSQGLADAWFLAWFAPAPLLWLSYGKAPTWQVILASAMAMLAGSIYALQCYPTAPVLVIAALVGPQIMLFPVCVAFARFVNRGHQPWATLAGFPAAWASMEFVVSEISPHGTYGSFAYSQVSAPFLIQGASLGGFCVVTFLLCLFANAVAMAMRAGRKNIAAVAAGFALCLGNAVFGLIRLAHPQEETVRVAAMIDETAMGQAWHARTLPEALSVIDTYASAIRSAASQGATFVVTPEGGMPLTPAWAPALRARLALLATETNVHIIAAFNQAEPAGDVAISFQPGGASFLYAKRHPVPFIEDRLTPGTQSGWLGSGRALEICKDMDFPGTIRADAAKGVRLMGVPAGDFGADAWLHARMAVLRSVEGGFAMVRAANNGLVLINDAQGRLVASKAVAPSGLTMVVAGVALGPGSTVYSRTGDWFAWFCLVASLAAAVMAVRTARRDWQGL